MRIALVYERLREEERSILKAIEELGHEPIPIHINSNFMSLNTDHAFPADIAIIRAISATKAHSSAVALESMGVKVINASDVLATCGNKLATTAKLSEAGIPTPKTMVAFSLDGALRAAKEIGYPVVVKPINGSWGRLVSLAEDEEDLRTILEHREAIPSPYYRIHYIQEFIRKPGRDIRAYGTEKEFVTAIYRISDHWITNTARGARAEPAPQNPELQELVVRTARAMGGGFLGMDIAEDEERGLLVLEVNAVTEFKNAARVTGVNIARELVSYALGVS
ncbi:MAG: lysine biosynthesis protein LysX [Candidatus Korarchaeota archaeon]|nr:lysine biosynthesis protein LysX [Candidatus Korarchaeota archaeon]